MTNLDKLKVLTELQCSTGSYDYDAYMHGMANGMILAVSIMDDGCTGEPAFLEAPKEWLSDKPETASATTDEASA